MIGLSITLSGPSVYAANNAPRLAPNNGGVFGDSEALRVVPREVTLWDAPSLKSHRRGTLQAGAEVWVTRRIPAEDCPEDWVLVGPSAWACDGPGVFEGRRDRRQLPEAQPSALEFARIGPNGALGYRNFSLVDQGIPDAELGPGFFVGIVEQRALGAERYYRTTHDLWLAGASLSMLSPSPFAGHPLDDQNTPPALFPYLPVGWIFVDNARARPKLDRTITGPKVPRLTSLSVLQHQLGPNHKTWFLTPVGWFSEAMLRVPSRAPAPPAARDSSGNFIDVDTSTQTLVAYRNFTPTFATLVSTGGGPHGSAAETPKGVHRIWVKLISSDMDNLEETNRLATAEATEDFSVAANLPEPYAVEAVPWVQFFSGGYGLHATYWHDNFGVPRSHGCVNLSLKDAARLFEFTSPKRAPGWQAVHPSTYDWGTVIQVR